MLTSLIHDNTKITISTPPVVLHSPAPPPTPPPAHAKRPSMSQNTPVSASTLSPHPLYQPQPPPTPPPAHVRRLTADSNLVPPSTTSIFDQVDVSWSTPNKLATVAKLPATLPEVDESNIDQHKANVGTRDNTVIQSVDSILTFTTSTHDPDPVLVGDITYTETGGSRKDSDGQNENEAKQTCIIS